MEKMASANLPSSHNQEDLRRLYHKAIKSLRAGDMNKPNHMNLYRNQDDHYFKRILETDDVMPLSLKDQNGDPGNPINGKLKGIFFMGNVDNDTMEPPDWALFGPIRFHVPLKALLENLGTWNMYFADFYCLAAYTTGVHYVTLVLCESGSEEDIFCQAKLFSLPQVNPFFQVRPDGTFSVSSKVWIEIFYTKEININEMLENKGAFWEIMTDVRGSKSPNGIPKNPDCSKCNFKGLFG